MKKLLRYCHLATDVSTLKSQSLRSNIMLFFKVPQQRHLSWYSLSSNAKLPVEAILLLVLLYVHAGWQAKNTATKAD